MRRAFTVIEVIVTFAIVSILIFFAIYSFRYSVANVKKASYYLPKTTIAYATLDHLLSGIYYYVIEPGKKDFVDFFNGTSSDMTFVTVSPFFSNTPAIGKLSYANNQINYTESRLYSKKNDYANPEISKNANSIILFHSVSSCHISYILQNGTNTETVHNKIPVGIILKFTQNRQKFHFIFSIQSNFKVNKVFLKNEKYTF